MEDIYRAFYIHSDILGHAELPSLLKSEQRVEKTEKHVNANALKCQGQVQSFRSHAKAARNPSREDSSFSNFHQELPSSHSHPI